MTCIPRKRGALMARVHLCLREHHYSDATEGAYVRWIRRYIEFSGVVHPLDLDESHLQHFLDVLVTDRKVSASTHQQALCAIVFLYRRVLEVDAPWIDGLVRPKQVQQVPVVMTKDECRRVLEKLAGVHWLAGSLLYGSGLRLRECLRLRVKDVDFDGKQIVVRRGKGDKDRVTLLPVSLRDPLRQHLQRVQRQHERDRARDAGYVELPDAIGLKYPRAATQWKWQWVFPATRRYRVVETGEVRRHHLHQSSLQRAVADAVLEAGITKNASCHTFRHYVSFRTMSGNARAVADMVGITDQIEKSSTRLPDIVFPGLQTVEKSQ